MSPEMYREIEIIISCLGRSHGITSPEPTPNHLYTTGVVIQLRLVYVIMTILTAVISQTSNRRGNPRLTTARLSSVRCLL